MAVSGCRACGRVFTGLSGFDKHQVWTRTERPRVQCLDPSTLGMVENEAGRWGNPGSYGVVTAPAAERPAHEFDRTCAECGTIFQRPRTRGRPPTKCPECRSA